MFVCFVCCCLFLFFYFVDIIQQNNGYWLLDQNKLYWINGCLTTPQHEKQMGYWVSEKGKRMKWLYKTNEVKKNTL